MVRHKHTFREATPGRRSRVIAGLVPATTTSRHFSSDGWMPGDKLGHEEAGPELVI